MNSANIPKIWRYYMVEDDPDGSYPIEIKYSRYHTQNYDEDSAADAAAAQSYERNPTDTCLDEDHPMVLLHPDGTKSFWNAYHQRDFNHTAYRDQSKEEAT